MEDDIDLAGDRPADEADGFLISHHGMLEFEELFNSWRHEGQNWGILELGACPDLEGLAAACLKWSDHLRDRDITYAK